MRRFLTILAPLLTSACKRGNASTCRDSASLKPATCRSSQPRFDPRPRRFGLGLRTTSASDPLPRHAELQRSVQVRWRRSSTGRSIEPHYLVFPAIRLNRDRHFLIFTTDGQRRPWHSSLDCTAPDLNLPLETSAQLYSSRKHPGHGPWRRPARTTAA